MVKKKATLALLPISLCFSSITVSAATNAELEERLEQQEQQIKRLENRLQGTRAAVKENRSRMADQNDRLKINGFMSGGFAVLDDEELQYPLYGISNEYNSSSVTKLGIQMTFQVSDKISATTQLTSKGTEDYNVDATWAYLDYQVMDDLKLRLGRTRLPYYLLSEYLDVGYAYPWVRPPIEMYNLPITETDGLTAFYDVNAGPVNLTFQLYGGSTSGYSKELNASFKNNNQWSFVTLAEVSDFTFRMAYSTSELEIVDLGSSGDPGYDLFYGMNSAITSGTTLLGLTTDLPLVTLGNNKAEYLSAAAMYDNGSLLVMGEIANLSVENVNQPAGDSGYVMVGYRFGKWMPNLTFAKYYTDSDSDQKMKDQIAYLDTLGSTLSNLIAVPGVPERLASATALRNGISSLIRQQQSYTLGLNYDLTNRVKLKAEVAFYENFGSISVAEFIGGTPVYSSSPGTGQFGVVSTIDSLGQPVSPNPNASSVGSHAAIYSFSVDAVF